MKMALKVSPIMISSASRSRLLCATARRTLHNDCSLTGGGERIASALVSKYHHPSEFHCVLDMGGRDSRFVHQFPRAERFIISPVFPISLDDPKEVRYVAGDPGTVLEDKSYLLNRTTQKTLFFMNNLIQSMTPAHGWKTIESTRNRMKPRDALAIINLSSRSFFEIKNCYEADEKYHRGICQYNKLESKSFYRSTIDHNFKLFILKRFDDIKLIEESSHTIHRVTRLDNEKIRTTEIEYITLLFHKKVEENSYAFKQWCQPSVRS